MTNLLPVVIFVVLGALSYLLARSVYMRYWEASDERAEAGFIAGRTLELDSRTLYSPRYGLAGKPDRIVDRDGVPIPEEWKSAGNVYPSHRVQMGVYLLLVEEEYGVRPPYGVIVLGDGKRVVVHNTGELRAQVLGIAEEIRATRRRPAIPILVRQPPAKCRACGVHQACRQRSG